MQRESLRRWTLKRSQVIFDKNKLVMSWFCLLTFNLLKDNFTTLVIS